MPHMYAKRKRMIVAVMSIVIAVLAWGCAISGGADTSGDASSASERQQAAKQEKTKETKKEKGEKPKKEKKQDIEKEVIVLEADEEATGAGQAEQSASQEDGEQSLAGRNQEAKSSEKAKNKKTSSGAASDQKSKPQTKKKHCSLTIECKALIGRSDIEPQVESLVPGDGYILRSAEVEISDGDTVYDILKKARKSYGFLVNATDTQFGIYIAGIAGIEEKACGAESGWKYKVNGSYPSKSCARISVADGDNIVWIYVLKA